MVCHSSGCMAPPRISSFDLMRGSSSPAKKWLSSRSRCRSRPESQSADADRAADERSREAAQSQARRRACARMCESCTPRFTATVVVAHAALRSHHHDQFVLAAAPVDWRSWFEAAPEFPSMRRGHRLGHEVLHAASHGVEQQLRTGRIRRGTAISLHRRPHPAQLRSEREVQFPDRAAGPGEQYPAITPRHPEALSPGIVHCFDGFHQPGLLQASQ